MTAFNIAFMICTVLVLIGAILTIIFVKASLARSRRRGAEGRNRARAWRRCENKNLLRTLQ